VADVKFFGDLLTETEIKQLASKINVDSATFGIDNRKAWYKINEGSGTSIVDHDDSGSDYDATMTNGTWIYDEYSVDVYDNSTTTDGTFTVTQGKVEGLALSSVDLNGSDDFININNSLESWTESAQKTASAWVYNDGNSNVARIFNTGYQDSGSKTAFAIGISLSGHANKPFAFLRDTSAGAIQQAFGEVHSTNTWMHYAVVQDGANDQAFLYQNGVLQATVSSVGEINATTSTSAKIGVHWDTGQGGYFNGKIKDVRLYDYNLSDEQIASLYSGSYLQTPLHHWKLDEGYTSGTTANTAGAFEDSGTGTDYDGQGAGLVNASCVNGTLDLDGSLTIAANGTLSAPRGTLDCAGDFHSSGAYTHNNGTALLGPSSGSAVIQNGGSPSEPVFYNLQARRVVVYNNITVENRFDAGHGGHYCYFYSPTIVTMGTTTSQGTFDIDSATVWFHNSKLYGASSLYPAIVDATNDLLFDSTTTSFFKNIDYQGALTTNGTGHDIQLDGDCEFDAVTIASGDTFDLNGQRMKASGLIDINGAFKDTTTTGASLIVAEGWNTAGSSGNNTATTAGERLNLILNNTGSDDANMFYSASGIYYDNIFVNGGEFTSYAGFGNQHTENFRIGSTFDVDHGWEMKNLTVCTGGTLDAGSQTLNCSGDFTTSGGLVNLSAFKGVYDDKDLIEVADHADLDFTNTFTAEIWFKSTRNDVHQYLFDRRGGSSGAAKSWFLYLDTDNGQLSARIRATSTAAGNTWKGNSTNLDDGKWHHAALVYDKDAADGRTKLYVDGKLDFIDDTAEGPLSADDSNFYIGGRYSYEFTWDGNLAEPRLWNVARTQAQIRADMFNSDTLANSTGLVGQWKMTEGTGSTFASTNTNLNGTAVSYSTGSEVAITDAWATAGTFTYGTSTLVMAKSGTQTICMPHNTDIRHLTVNDGSTTQILTLGTTNGLIDIQGNLVVNEKVKSHADTNQSRLRMRGGDNTITIGSDVKTTALAEIYELMFDISGGSGNINAPELTTQMIKITNGSVTATGDLTLTRELEVNSGTTFDANTNTISAKGVDVNAGTLDLRNSTLNFSVTNSGDFFEMDGSSTLLTGNTAITGHSSATKTPAILLSSGGFEVVGDVKFLAMSADADLTVIGAVIDCDTSESGSNIRQFHHTLDTQQLLDADEAGDDDLRLEKPTLDNANELQTG
jgi:hypothetical protein